MMFDISTDDMEEDFSDMLSSQSKTKKQWSAQKMKGKQFKICYSADDTGLLVCFCQFVRCLITSPNRK